MKLEQVRLTLSRKETLSQIRQTQTVILSWTEENRRLKCSRTRFDEVIKNENRKRKMQAKIRPQAKQFNTARGEILKVL
jgi:hypothetical protein